MTGGGAGTEGVWGGGGLEREAETDEGFVLFCFCHCLKLEETDG